MEYRYFENNLRSDGRNVQGTAIVFNSKSKFLDNKFYELILPEAITEQYLRTQSFPMLVNHNSDAGVLASYQKGNGTLKPTITRNGVDFSFISPNTKLGNEVLTGIKSGFYPGCSFSFQLNNSCVRWEKRDGYYIRYIHRFISILDFSLVNNPAYEKTSVHARSMDALNNYFETEIRGLNNDDLKEKFSKETIEREIYLEEYYKQLRQKYNLK